MFDRYTIVRTRLRIAWRGALAPLAAVHAVASAASVVHSYGTGGSGAAYDTATTLFTWQVGLLVLGPPAVALGTLRSARRSGLLDGELASPLHPTRVVLEYAVAAVAMTLVVAMPGAVACFMIERNLAIDAAAGPGGAQCLALTTGIVLASGAIVFDLLARGRAAGIVLVASLTMLGVSMSAASGTAFGSVVPAALIFDTALGAPPGRQVAPAMLPVAWCVQIVVVAGVVLAASRSLDPRRPRHAVRWPVLAMLGMIAALELLLVHLGLTGSGSDDVPPAVPAVFAAVLLGSTAASREAWFDALRTCTGTRTVSLISVGAGLGMLALVALLPSDRATRGAVVNLGLATLPVTVAALADAWALLHHRGRALVLASIAVGAPVFQGLPEHQGATLMLMAAVALWTRHTAIATTGDAMARRVGRVDSLP